MAMHIQIYQNNPIECNLPALIKKTSSVFYSWATKRFDGAIKIPVRWTRTSRFWESDGKMDNHLSWGQYIQKGSTTSQTFSCLTANFFTNIKRSLTWWQLYKVYTTPLSESSECTFPKSRFPQQCEKIQGLVPTVIEKCHSCNYVSKNFELFKRLDANSKSNIPAQIDIRLRQYMASNETSLASIQCLFCLVRNSFPVWKNW